MDQGAFNPLGLPIACNTLVLIVSTCERRHFDKNETATSSPLFTVIFPP